MSVPAEPWGAAGLIALLPAGAAEASEDAADPTDWICD